MEYPLHYPYFFTATILEWKYLLKPDKYKKVITDCLSFLVKEKRVQVFGFAVMINHVHIIWRAMPDYKTKEIQHSFMKFTAQMIIKDLRNNHPKVLQRFFVGAKDRKYQIWERNPLSIEIRSSEVMFQKLNYIHNNPAKAVLCMTAEKYLYSSAALYVNGLTPWNFLEKW